MRKPSDLLAKGLHLKESRGDSIRTSDLYVPKLVEVNCTNTYFALKPREFCGVASIISAVAMLTNLPLNCQHCPGYAPAQFAVESGRIGV